MRYASLGADSSEDKVVLMTMILSTKRTIFGGVCRVRTISLMTGFKGDLPSLVEFPMPSMVKGSH